jgi:hypothetical protein
VLRLDELFVRALHGSPPARGLATTMHPDGDSDSDYRGDHNAENVDQDFHNTNSGRSVATAQQVTRSFRSTVLLALTLGVG